MDAPEHINMHTFICTPFHKHIQTYIHIHTHIHTHVYTHTHIPAQTHIICTHTYTHIYICTYTHAYTHTYIQIHAQTYICTHTYTHTYTHIYTCIYFGPCCIVSLSASFNFYSFPCRYVSRNIGKQPRPSRHPCLLPEGDVIRPGAARP